MGSAAPLPPRLPDDLVPVTDPELLDDEEWAGLEVTGDFSNRSIEDPDLRASRVRASQFTATTLVRPGISDVAFDDCELSGTRFVDAALTRVTFRRCRMSGFDLALGRLRHVQFVDCRLDGANLRMVDAEQVGFEGCEMTESDFYGAKASEMTFADCDLSGAAFSQATLTGARFAGSRLADLRGATALAGAVIDAGQIVPLALGLFAALDITVED
jgi:uncharacterized protein YjbI with pentapeptide repeats